MLQIKLLSHPCLFFFIDPITQCFREIKHTMEALAGKKCFLIYYIVSCNNMFLSAFKNILLVTGDYFVKFYEFGSVFFL